MEKCYKVLITIKNQSGQFGGGKDPHCFINLSHDEETAKLKAMIDAYNLYPIEQGWSYEVKSVEEKTRQDVEDFLFRGKSLC
jgi:hypothetical protein